MEYLQSGGTAEDMAIESRPLNIKVYHKLEVKSFVFDSNEKYSDFFEKVLEHYQIKDRENCRLRFYNPYTDQL